jgi:hypothetical protein
MRLLVRSILLAGLCAWPSTTTTEPESPTPVAESGQAGARPSGGDLERFVPSEELPADSAISFPVDI